jgi:hypothetical protein
MTNLIQSGPGTMPGNAVTLAAHERTRIRTAARHARTVYPGDLGELVARELNAYAEFGYRFSTDALVPRLATHILARHGAPADVPSLTDRRHRPAERSRPEAS